MKSWLERSENYRLCCFIERTDFIPSMMPTASFLSSTTARRLKSIFINRDERADLSVQYLLNYTEKKARALMKLFGFQLSDVENIDWFKQDSQEIRILILLLNDYKPENTDAISELILKFEP
jgi:hypothetical protein